MTISPQFNDFILGLPKAELHLHIEGTFEPELIFEIAQRNSKPLHFKTIEEIKAASNFHNLQEFLDLYYQAAGVLITTRDFYDLTIAYFQKAKEQGIVHAEIFFDPQTHTERGISFQTVIEGIHQACLEAEKQFGISSKIILCFLRHLDQNQAQQTLEAALPFKNLITAIGLDSGEKGNPPSKFTRVFEQARQLGFKAVAHAGEEGPAEYVWEAINLLKVERVDHGNHSIDDPKLLAYLAQTQLPLTMCPLSNLKLQVLTDLRKHPLKKLLAQNIKVTINSDDPAYFGGYLTDNYLAITEALDLNPAELVKLAKNSIEASFLELPQKQNLLQKIDQYYADSAFASI